MIESLRLSKYLGSLFLVLYELMVYNLLVIVIL